jgi:MFS family permease
MGDPQETIASVLSVLLHACVQGAVAAAFSSTGSGMLADIIPPEHRGTAMGISNIPMFIGA